MADGRGLHRSASCPTNNSCNDIEEGRGRTWLLHLTWLLESGELGCCFCPLQPSYTGYLQYERKRFLFYHLCSSVFCPAFPPKQGIVKVPIRKMVIIWKDIAGCWFTPEGMWSFINDLMSWTLYSGISLSLSNISLPHLCKKSADSNACVMTFAVKMLPPGIYRGKWGNWAGKSSFFICIWVFIQMACMLPAAQLFVWSVIVSWHCCHRQDHFLCSCSGLERPSPC